MTASIQRYRTVLPSAEPIDDAPGSAPPKKRAPSPALRGRPPWQAPSLEAAIARSSPKPVLKEQ